MRGITPQRGPVRNAASEDPSVLMIMMWIHETGADLLLNISSMRITNTLSSKLNSYNYNERISKSSSSESKNRSSLSESVKSRVGKETATISLSVLWQGYSNIAAIHKLILDPNSMNILLPGVRQWTSGKRVFWWSISSNIGRASFSCEICRERKGRADIMTINQEGCYKRQIYNWWDWVIQCFSQVRRMCSALFMSAHAQQMWTCSEH